MLTVRKATKEDIDIVYELILAIAKHHNQQQFVVTDKQTLLEDGFLPSAKFGILLAEIGGKIAGYCSYTWNYSIWQGTRYMNIDDVFVWAAHRGKKVGESLMSAAENVCKENGINRIKWEVEQDNLGAIKFYQRLGAELAVKGLFRWDIK